MISDDLFKLWPMYHTIKCVNENIHVKFLRNPQNFSWCQDRWLFYGTGCRYDRYPKLYYFPTEIRWKCINLTKFEADVEAVTCQKYGSLDGFVRQLTPRGRPQWSALGPDKKQFPRMRPVYCGNVWLLPSKLATWPQTRFKPLRDPVSVLFYSRESPYELRFYYGALI